MYYKDVEGNKVIDGKDGIWWWNEGNGRKRIKEEVERKI